MSSNMHRIWLTICESGTQGASAPELARATGIEQRNVAVAIHRLRERELVIRFIPENDQDTIRYRRHPKREFSPDAKKTRIEHPPAKPDPANSCPLEEFWPSVK